MGFAVSSCGTQGGRRDHHYVEMLKRINYGTAKVRVTYSVRPFDELEFEVTLESKVKMATLPQAGQEVRASYDPDKHERLEVLTPPGEERGTVTTRTVELPYFDSAHPVSAEIQQVRESPRVNGARRTFSKAAVALGVTIRSAPTA